MQQRYKKLTHFFTIIAVILFTAAAITAICGVTATLRLSAAKSAVERVAVYGGAEEAAKNAEQTRAQIEAAATENSELENVMKGKEATYSAISELLTQARQEIDEVDADPETLQSQIAALQEKESQLQSEYETLYNQKNPGGASGGKVAYLTFDDGVSANTLKILDILKEQGVKATFFVNWKEGCDDIYRRIVNEGHTLANHTATHQYGSVYKDAASFEAEVTSLNDKLKAITGVTPTVFRFPGGSNNTVHRSYTSDPNIIDSAMRCLSRLGMTYFDWNVDSGDSSANLVSVDRIRSGVLNGCGSQQRIVVLMHDLGTKTTTPEALPSIIEGLRQKGYSFAAITDATTPVQFVASPY